MLWYLSLLQKFEEHKLESQDHHLKTHKLATGSLSETMISINEWINEWMNEKFTNTYIFLFYFIYLFFYYHFFIIIFFFFFFFFFFNSTGTMKN